MPPKIDPDTTKLHSRINVFLLVLTILIFAIGLRTSAHGQTAKIGSEWENDDWWAERAASFFPRYPFTLQPTNLRYGLDRANSPLATTFTYSRATSNTSGTADQWSAGTNWSATPVSATDTTLTFSATVAAGATIFTNNNIAGDFKLNILNFTYAGPGSGTQPTVTISGNRLEFINNGATTPTMSIAATGTIKPLLTISNDLLLTNNLSITATSDGILSGVISGGGSLTKLGGGALTISGANTYTGGTTISGGTLQLNAASSAGTGAITLNDANTGANNVQLTLNPNVINSITNAITVANQGTGTSTIKFSSTTANAVSSATGAWTLNRATTFDCSGGFSNYFAMAHALVGSATLTVSSTNNTRLELGDGVTAGTNSAFTGDIILNSGAILEMRGNFSAATGNNVTVNSGAELRIALVNSSIGGLNGAGTVRGTTGLSGATLTVGKGNATGSFSGTIQNLGTSPNSLIKIGAGTQTLSGANTYTGATTVSGGTLLINGNQTAATGAVTVNNSGSVLGGTGTIGGAVTVNANAKLQGGDGTTGTTLTLSGAVTLSDNSIVQLALGPSLTHSTLTRSGSNTWIFDSNQAFTFIDLGATIGTYQNIITGIADPPSENLWTITNPGWAGTFVYDGANIDLTLTAVPEPSTWAAGFLALVAIAYSQRRRLRKVVRASAIA